MFKSVKIGILALIGMIAAILFLGGLIQELLTQDRTGRGGEESARTIPRPFQKALRAFKKGGLFYDQQKTLKIQDAATLNAYLKRTDPTSEYLEASEYSVFETSHKDNYVGIGMEIEKNEAGQIICYPYPGSPAHVSGVESGDILHSVDGQKVSGLSIYMVGSKMMGPEDTRITITVIKKSGKKRDLSMTRMYIAKSSVTAIEYTNLNFIKIHAFSIGTKRDLKSALGQLKKNAPIILDLRDNPGGDLYKAIDSAMLFLEKGVKIVTIKSREDSKTYHSTTPAIQFIYPIYIWQNENTASAAEVFIAALTLNRRAESIGRKSYGKGTTQDIVKLDDGSAIVFASGYLMTPDDRIYHQHGLAPTHKLTGDSLSINDYLLKTQALLSSDRHD